MSLATWCGDVDCLWHHGVYKIVRLCRQCVVATFSSNIEQQRLPCFMESKESVISNYMVVLVFACLKKRAESYEGCKQGLVSKDLECESLDRMHPWVWKMHIANLFLGNISRTLRMTLGAAYN